MRLLKHHAGWLNEGIFELHVEGNTDELAYDWQRVEMAVNRVPVGAG